MWVHRVSGWGRGSSGQVADEGSRACPLGLGKGQSSQQSLRLGGRGGTLAATGSHALEKEAAAYSLSPRIPRRLQGGMRNSATRHTGFLSRSSGWPGGAGHGWGPVPAQPEPVPVQPSAPHTGSPITMWWGPPSTGTGMGRLDGPRWAAGLAQGSWLLYSSKGEASVPCMSMALQRAGQLAILKRRPRSRGGSDDGSRSRQPPRPLPGCLEGRAGAYLLWPPAQGPLSNVGTRR